MEIGFYIIREVEKLLSLISVALPCGQDVRLKKLLYIDIMCRHGSPRPPHNLERWEGAVGRQLIDYSDFVMQALNVGVRLKFYNLV